MPRSAKQRSPAIGNLRLPALHGSKIPLKEIAEIKTITGPAFVYRDKNTRFIAVKFTVRNRDMGSTIAEAQEKVDDRIRLGKGFSIEWAGEFENQVRAQAKLAQVVPVVLVLIFILLFISFGNALDAGLVLINVPFALIGGILALQTIPAEGYQTVTLGTLPADGWHLEIAPNCDVVVSVLLGVTPLEPKRRAVRH